MAQKKKASKSTTSSPLDLSSLPHTVLRAEKDRRIALQFQIEQIPDDALNAEIQRRHDKMIETLKNQDEVL